MGISSGKEDIKWGFTAEGPFMRLGCLKNNHKDRTVAQFIKNNQTADFGKCAIQ